MSGEEKEEIQKLFVAIAIGGGLVGGIIVALFNHYLTKDRERSRDRESKKAEVKTRRLEFLGFLRAWRMEFHKKILGVGGWRRNVSAFTSTLPNFVSEVELIRADFVGAEMAKFDELAGAISECDDRNFNDEKRYNQLLHAVDALITFLEKSN